MQTIEYSTIDKSSWGEGPWQNEPDKKQWLDEQTGYPCLIVRNPRHGGLCGYVGISEHHTFFQKPYHAVDLIDVHGGLTFSDHCRLDADESTGICHKIDREDRVWWFGFDCAHCFDLCPHTDSLIPLQPHEDLVYRDWNYVTSEVQLLAKQLKMFE